MISKKRKQPASKPVKRPARPAVVTTAAPRPATAPEYAIEELAQLARTTVRNIRAYQDRGIIPPPQRRGRSGYYGETHLSRLRMVGSLLPRGYTLASIGELIAAWERGHDLGSFMGLEAAVASPWGDEQPVTFSLQQLVDLFGSGLDPLWLAKACEFDLLQQDGANFRAPSPSLLQAGAELARAGIPLPKMIEVIASLRIRIGETCELMVQLVDEHVFGQFGAGLPPAAEAPRLRDLIWRLRPLVEMAVKAEVARAMETIATRHLGDRLEHVLEHFVEQRPKKPAALKRPARARGSR